VFDRRRRHTGFDQLDPATINDFVAGRCADSHGPAEMMSDPHTHTLKYHVTAVSLSFPRSSTLPSPTYPRFRTAELGHSGRETVRL